MDSLTEWRMKCFYDGFCNEAEKNGACSVVNTCGPWKGYLSQMDWAV